MPKDGEMYGPSALVEVMAEILLDTAAYSDESGELAKDEYGCENDPVTWACATDEGKELGRRLARKALEVMAEWAKAPEPACWSCQGDMLVPLVELPPGFVAIRHDHLEADIDAILGQGDVTCINVSWHRIAGSDTRFTSVSIHGHNPSTIIAYPDSFQKSPREVWDAAKELLETHRKKVADGVQ